MSELNLNTLTQLQTTYQRIVCEGIISQQSDAFIFLQKCAQALEPGGVLVIQDVLLPEDERAAYYVDAFYGLLDAEHERGYAEYEWRGLLLDVGLKIVSLEITSTVEMIPPDVHLQIMLVQAPLAVAQFLKPTQDKYFERHYITLQGKKEH